MAVVRIEIQPISPTGFVDRSDYFAYEPMSIEWLANRGATLSATALDTKDGTYRPNQNEEIRVYDGVDLIFGGVITDATSTYNGRTRETRIAARDYMVYAERRIAPSGSFTDGTTLKQVLQSLVSLLSEFGVTLHPSQDDGPTFSGLSWSPQYVNSILADLARTTGRIASIDSQKRLLVQNPTTYAPFTLSGSDSYVEFTDRGKNETQYNRVWLAIGTGTRAYTHTFTGDGITRVFPLPFTSAVRPAQLSDNGNPPTYFHVAIYGVDTLFEWTYRASDNAIVQLPEAPPGTFHAPLGNGVQRSTVGYVAAYPAYVKAENVGPEKSFDVLFEAPEIFDLAEGQSTANQILATRVGRKQAAFVTRKKGLQPGQILTVSLPDHGHSGDYVVGSVRWRWENPYTPVFSVEIMEGSNASPGSYLDLYEQWTRGGGSSAGVIAGGVSGGSSGGGGLLGPTPLTTERHTSIVPGVAGAAVRNAVEVPIDSNKVSGVTVRIKIRRVSGSGTLTPQLRNLTDGSVAGQGTATSSSTFTSQVFAATTLGSGLHLYALYLVGSDATTEGIAYGTVEASFL